MALTFKEVAEILKIIDASDCEEVVLELEGIKLSVRRGSSSHSVDAATSRSVPDASPAIAPPVGTPFEASRTPSSRVATNGIEIRAPMVGTFYQSSSPDLPAFVEVGQHVSAGDPLCLIEVMKLYTTIESQLAGTISSIEVNNGALVEFDQLLFVIDPD